MEGKGRAKAFLCSVPCHAACMIIVPHSGKGAAGHFLCPMARHRPCYSSRGSQPTIPALLETSYQAFRFSFETGLKIPLICF